MPEIFHDGPRPKDGPKSESSSSPADGQDLPETFHDLGARPKGGPNSESSTEDEKETTVTDLPIEPEEEVPLLDIPMETPKSESEAEDEEVIPFPNPLTEKCDDDTEEDEAPNDIKQEAKMEDTKEEVKDEVKNEFKHEPADEIKHEPVHEAKQEVLDPCSPVSPFEADLEGKPEEDLKTLRTTKEDEQPEADLKTLRTILTQTLNDWEVKGVEEAAVPGTTPRAKPGAKRPRDPWWDWQEQGYNSRRQFMREVLGRDRKRGGVNRQYYEDWYKRQR